MIIISKVKKLCFIISAAVFKAFQELNDCIRERNYCSRYASGKRNLSRDKHKHCWSICGKLKSLKRSFNNNGKRVPKSVQYLKSIVNNTPWNSPVSSVYKFIKIYKVTKIKLIWQIHVLFKRRFRRVSSFSSFYDKNINVQVLQWANHNLWQWEFLIPWQSKLNSSIIANSGTHTLTDVKIRAFY